MKIVYLAAGAAGMYCGSCLHDNTLAAALLKAGEDVLLVPTYTPLRTDEENVSERRLFFGGINVYLQQNTSLFRHTPWFVDRPFDSPGLVNMAAKLGRRLDPHRLGSLAVSMLRGEQGYQRKELDKLVRWLQSEARPDVVHLSNSMLVGMAGEIRRRGVPVVCSLSGEDIFLEQLPAPYYEQARQALAERVGHVDAFVALNHYYADFMATYLPAPRERIHVIPHGLNLTGHGTRQPSPGAPFTVGYLARIAPEKGLHHLVSAFELLNDDPALPELRLKVAGYLGAGEMPYFADIQARVQKWKDPRRFEYAGELTRDEKIRFLQSLDVMSLPTVYRESKGLSVLEALANAVPVVLPEHGTFPEVIADTGGGILHRPEDPPDLAAALKRLILNPQEAISLGLRGQQAVHARYNAATMAHQTRELYQRVQATFKA